MTPIKIILAVIALTLAFDNMDRGLFRLSLYWALVCVYWTANALL